MTRTRRTAVLAGLLVGVLMLAGCEGTVVKREPMGDGKYKIVYKRDDGAERIEIVNKAVFDACDEGEKWPQCKDGIHNGMRNLPAPEGGAQNDPYRDPDRDAQDRNARTVCFDFVSEPKRKLSYRWRTARREKGPREGIWGIYSECVLVQVGEVVNMKVEHITGPSTLLCTIYIMRMGKKVWLDMMVTQAFGDCDVAAVVPPN